MLKKYSKLFKGFFVIFDTLFIMLSWALAFKLRFVWFNFSSSESHLDFIPYFRVVFFILPVFLVVFSLFGLYQPMRIAKGKKELLDIFRAFSFALILFISILYFFKQINFSRIVFGYFWVCGIGLIVLARISIRGVLRSLRKNGFNLRRILIVGTGDLARQVAQKIREHTEFGLTITGFMTEHIEDVPAEIDNIPVLGVYRDIPLISKQYSIDQIVFALPLKEERMIRVLLGLVNEESTDLNVVLDLRPFFFLRQSVDELDDLLVINIRESPFYGWNSIIKRVFDLFVAAATLVILSPLFIIIIVSIRSTSRGGIFYRQTRLSLNGRSFNLIKFRTMKVDAESMTGPVWAKADDGRRTAVGRFLRRWSLDEMPQLINVIKGDMSIVGPRPEREVFVEEFRKHVPKYMLRHIIRSGMTGWAQIHGLRGDTSLEKRLEYDLYYIEHWSLGLDIKIALRTIPAILEGNGAY